MIKLIWVALLSDLLTPILIWQAGLPAEFRWISHAAFAVVIVMGLASLLRQRDVPKAVGVILLFSVIGGLLGWSSGQGASATLWGWYLMFKYPLVGLCIYLDPPKSPQFPGQLRTWCLRLLLFEVAVQVWQYLGGLAPGDSLAGTLGPGGTGLLAMMVLLVTALALGAWIVRGTIAQLGMVVVLGVVSSILGEMKIYFFAVAALGSLAVLIRGVRHRNIGRTLPLVFVVGLSLWLFPVLYDAFVPSAQWYPFSRYLDEGFLNTYASILSPGERADDVGRGLGLYLVWQRISASPLTLLFGEGLGARGVSDALGSVGVGVSTSGLGLYTGTSLLVILGEAGLTGLGCIAMFLLWTLKKLWKATSVEQTPDLAALQYGLLLYTVLWPLWLYYTSAWVAVVSAPLYWIALGYVLAKPHGRALTPQLDPVSGPQLRLLQGKRF
jgi:hypothetical protein